MPVLESPPQRTSPPARRTARPRHGRGRVLVSTALVPIAVGYLSVATLLAVVTAIAANAEFSAEAVLAMAVPGWLAAYHVPLGLGTHSLGVLPLLPTALVMLLIARSAASGAQRLRLSEPAQARQIVFPVAGAHAVVGVTVALLLGGSPVTAAPAVAFFGCGAISGLAATIGLARRCCLLEVLLSRVDPVVVRGLRAGAMGVLAMFAGGAFLFTIGLVVHWTTLAEVFAKTGASFGSAVGILLLCVGYLPNAVIASLAFAMGPGFTMGGASVNPFHFTLDKVPAVPLFAAMPIGQGRLLLATLAVPLAVGLFLGWACRRIAPRPLTRMRAVLVAAAVVGGVFFVLAALAGGRLGGGVFSPITAPAGLIGVVAFGWVLLPALPVAWLAGPKAEPVTEEATAEPPAEAEAVVGAEDGAEDEAVAQDEESAADVPSDEGEFAEEDAEDLDAGDHEEDYEAEDYEDLEGIEGSEDFEEEDLDGEDLVAEQDGQPVGEELDELDEELAELEAYERESEQDAEAAVGPEQPGAARPRDQE
ncbi:hypothetical protein BC739_008678 [Kutzneria viridogrisea]|uniref:Uncharacterized protein n=1 Tax=Kutzneria viridogrisea TaxID=47990 RepID=A0ABR6BWZ2_9PSEU|nr:hypothetical protein [Kutzneria viridogrisea]